MVERDLRLELHYLRWRDWTRSRIATRSRAGSWPGFSNALMLTGDQSFVGVLRRQMDNIYAQKKVEDGKTLLPQMYGDPKGYKENGAPSWYHYTGNLFQDRLTEIYFWSMDRKDLERVPMQGWVGFLEGQEPRLSGAGACRRISNAYVGHVRDIEADSTTADTRLADYLMGLNPAVTDALTNLTMGAFLTGNIWSLHSRFRYFDPVRRRAGLPRRRRRAGGEAGSRRGDAGPGERGSRRGANGCRAGRRLRRAPVRLCRDRRQDADDRRTAAECAARARIRRAASVPHGALCESSDARAAVGSRLFLRTRSPRPRRLLVFQIQRHDRRER